MPASSWACPTAWARCPACCVPSSSRPSPRRAATTTNWSVCFSPHPPLPSAFLLPSSPSWQQNQNLSVAVISLLATKSETFLLPSSPSWQQNQKPFCCRHLPLGNKIRNLSVAVTSLGNKIRNLLVADTFLLATKSESFCCRHLPLGNKIRNLSVTSLLATKSETFLLPSPPSWQQNQKPFFRLHLPLGNKIRKKMF